MLFTPKILKVGYQKRDNTYTKTLAYVSYIDHKDVFRKEPSWQSWRDKSIEPSTFDNVPTEGFVLNKTVGGGRGWAGRATWTRIFDPRGFEFEITIDNLLFILEETNSIKGKGLEGEFVYAWSGADLVLVPVTSNEYKESIEYSNKLYLSEKSSDYYLTNKDLKEGFKYTFKNGDIKTYVGKYKIKNTNIYGEDKTYTKYVFSYIDTRYNCNNIRFDYLTTIKEKIFANTIIEKDLNFDNILEESLYSITLYPPIGEKTRIHFTKELLLELIYEQISARDAQYIKDKEKHPDYKKPSAELPIDSLYHYTGSISTYFYNRFKVIEQPDETFKIEICAYNQKFISPVTSELSLDEFIEKYKPCYYRTDLSSGKFFTRGSTKQHTKYHY